MTMHHPIAPNLTVRHLTQWLQAQPPEREYIYQDPARCLLGHMLRDYAADEAISETLYETMTGYRLIAEPKPHTFGAALTRAETLLAYDKLGIDPTNPNPDGSDYHLMNAVDEQLALPAPKTPEGAPLTAGSAIPSEEVPENKATPSAVGESR